MLKRQAMQKYKDRVVSKLLREKRDPKGEAYKDLDAYDEVFETTKPEEAKGMYKKIFSRKKEWKYSISVQN